MARPIHKLSARTVEIKRKPGVYGDGGGLYLQVGPTGSKSWLFRFTLHGRAREMGLGPLHTVSLAEAREKAIACRKLLAEGIDPIEHRNAERRRAQLETAKTLTFSESAAAYIEANKAAWRNHKHAAQWRNTLNTYAAPVLGDLPVQTIDTALVLRVLEPIWREKTETANRVRGRIEAVLDWATARGFRTGENPARWRGHLDKLLPRRSKVQPVKHHAALPYIEMGKFVACLRLEQGGAARALEFAILTAARVGEVIGAKWREIDLDARVWTIPSERMKAHREHRVPLSDRAIEILDEMRPFRREDDYVFPGLRSGKSLSNASMLALLQRRMGYKNLTVHGFRASFRTWAAERTNFSREIAEAALSHVLKDKTEAAYQRGDLFERRRKLMHAWASYLNSEGEAKVTQLARAAA